MDPGSAKSATNSLPCRWPSMWNGEHPHDRLLEPDRDDLSALRHRFAGTQEEGNALPTGVLDIGAQRDERFGLGVRRHPGFVEVSVVLTPDDVGGIQRGGRIEDLADLIAQRLGVE